MMKSRSAFQSARPRIAVLIALTLVPVVSAAAGPAQAVPSAAPQVSVASHIAFRVQLVGSTSAPRQVTVTDTGGADLRSPQPAQSGPTGAGRAVVPGAPAAPIATSVGSRVVEAVWRPPTVDGGSPVTSYEAVARSRGGVTRTCRTAQDRCMFDRLTPRKHYRVQVRARNAAGWGGMSQSSARVWVRSVPSAPGRPFVRQLGNGKMHVRWRNPSDSGGAKVRHSIAVAAAPGAPTRSCRVPAKQKTCVLQPLRNRTRYTIRVHAENALGFGPWSRSRTVKVRR